jgi:hypothetical protein
MFSNFSHTGNANQKITEMSLTPVRMSIIKKITTNADKDGVGGGNCKYC